MNRLERRKNKWKKVHQRIELVKNQWATWCKPIDNLLPPDGYFSNNNEVNAWMGGGTKKKTKAKDGHASYRHKGTYGKAVDYSPHDQRQIDNYNDQIEQTSYEEKSE